MKFAISQYNQFCSRLRIDSKESEGGVLLTQKNKWSTQKYLIREIVKGLEDDIHFFVVLKGRQEGITSECSALDLFWMYRFPGTQGTFIAHEEAARDTFRNALITYHKGLPLAYRKPMLQNNRHFIAWGNRSRLTMLINGAVQSKAGKGRGGRGIGRSFVHGTECSSYSDQESFDSMLASLAQRNPQRLYVFESTARGYELFHDMWVDADMAVSRKRIFVGWWLQDLYRVERNSKQFAVYGREDPTPLEAGWMRDIKSLYDFDIEPEQLAWWRWMSAEEITDENTMLQEYPPTENHAFILSGANFFPVTKLKEISDRIRGEEQARFYSFNFGQEFFETTMDETIAKNAQLTIWEEPDLQWGFYAIGCDSAYGSSDWADQFCAQVFRCYQDRVEQVAEYCVTDITTDKFAWVICYLAGLYRNTIINLEFQGGGEAVMAEMQRLKRRASSIPPGPEKTALTDVRGNIRYHVFRRLDSVSGGGGAYHTVTTRSKKEGYLNMFKDLLVSGRCTIHSMRLVQECQIFVRDDDGSLNASGRGKDDRVIAAGLACLEYKVHQLPMLMNHRGTDWASEMGRRQQKLVERGEITPVDQAVERMVGKYLQAAGMRGMR